MQPGAATALTQLLKLNGRDATPCFDGAACLQHAINWRPHAALLDIGMPFMDGWEVARNLRQLDIGHPIVLIAVTNHDEPKHRARSIAAASMPIWQSRPASSASWKSSEADAEPRCAEARRRAMSANEQKSRPSSLYSVGCYTTCYRRTATT